MRRKLLVMAGGTEVDIFPRHRCCSNLKRRLGNLLVRHQRSNGGTAGTKAWYSHSFIQIPGLRGKGIKALLGALLLF